MDAAQGNGAAPGGVVPCPSGRPAARPQGVAGCAAATYAPGVRSVRITGLGLVLVAVAAVALAAMLTVDRLVVPGGVVLGLVLLMVAGDGTMLRAVDGLAGQHRVEEQPGPRRPRFRREAPPASAEVDAEAWRRERERRRRPRA